MDFDNTKMNQKVEKYLAKAEEAKQAEKEKRRILIAAGLFEKETVYSDSCSAECPFFDSEKRKYYGTKKNPVDVTEEEYAEILKYTTTQKGKEEEEEEEIDVSPVNDSAEKTLKAIAAITLICGIIASIICFATLCFQKMPGARYSYITETKFNPSGLGIAFSILIVSIAAWAMMKVFANISITLKELNSKIKK